MAFGSFEPNQQQPMAEINTTPLVDVMLVLLIIFMITAPLMTQSIQVELPAAEGSATPEQPDVMTIEIQVNGQLRWNGKPLVAQMHGKLPFADGDTITVHADPAAIHSFGPDGRRL